MRGLFFKTFFGTPPVKKKSFSLVSVKSTGRLSVKTPYGTPSVTKSFTGFCKSTPTLSVNFYGTPSVEARFLQHGEKKMKQALHALAAACSQSHVAAYMYHAEAFLRSV